MKIKLEFTIDYYDPPAVSALTDADVKEITRKLHAAADHLVTSTDLMPFGTNTSPHRMKNWWAEVFVLKENKP